MSIATFSLLTACAAGETAVDARASTGDGGVDADTFDAFDAQNYGSEDFSSFRHSFYGTGISGSVSMDRDCGIASKGARRRARDARMRRDARANATSGESIARSPVIELLVRAAEESRLRVSPGRGVRHPST